LTALDFLSSCTSGGCGAKIAADELSQILCRLPRFEHPSLLVGFDTSDDAAVYQLSPDQAIISTVDFFSPMVDDPRAFGRIAAANAMSDVYAMGGKVLFALNLVCFPQKMEKIILEEILSGGAEKIQEAGALLCGGHSIYDHEPKYGLAVTGSVHPGRILRNNTCQPGDCLILTKALGVGLVMSAARAGLAGTDEQAAAVGSMERLNKYAAEKLERYAVNACTDVTGFGLLAHAYEMAGTEHTLVIDTEQLPLLPRAFEYAQSYYATAAGQRNRNFMQGKTSLEGIAPGMQEILFDPQTSGGLLISVAEQDAQSLLADIQTDDPAAALIGQVVPKEEQSILVL
jgi:selenide,water dikinase